MRGDGRVFRLYAYALVLPWIGASLSRWRHGELLYGIAAIALGAVALAVRRRAPHLLASRAWRSADVLLWNAVSVVVAGEVALRLALATGLAPVWLDDTPDSLRYRLDPAGQWMGAAPNALGFYDTDWDPAPAPGVTRVAVLGDSFSAGMVPYPENYVTLADEALGPETEFLNFGVVHTAVQEYREILEREALRFQPQVVLVGIFVGNDIRADAGGVFSRYAGSRLFGAVRILWTVSRSGAAYRMSNSLDPMYRFEADGSRTELPLQSVDKHLARTAKHLEWIFGEPDTAEEREAWRDTERAIEELASVCRERGLRLLATIAPDEVQVDGDLLVRASAHLGASPSDFDLEYPNRRLRGKLEALGVPVLDFTPALREAERDGHTYHLRAVHWNRRGNAVAAAALGSWYRQQLAPRSPSAADGAQSPAPESSGSVAAPTPSR